MPSENGGCASGPERAERAKPERRQRGAALQDGFGAQQRPQGAQQRWITGRRERPVGRQLGVQDHGKQRVGARLDAEERAPAERSRDHTGKWA
jgi:hypothetical protein